jgi:hypothetical protein
LRVAIDREELVMMPAGDPMSGVATTRSSLLSVTIEAGGRTQIACHIPKLEAVKLLLSVVEELRAQAYQERDRLVQVPSAVNSADVRVT